MQIDVEYFGVNGLYVKALGRLDLDLAVEYGATIKDAIDDAPDEIKELVLDFSEITFISSFGLKVVLELYKEMQGKEGGYLKLKNVSNAIMVSFKMVGFDKFLTIE